MDELEVFKRKIEEKFASSDAKRIVPELVMICIQRIDLISKRLDEIESKILNSTSNTTNPINMFLREVKPTIKENDNADTNT